MGYSITAANQQLKYVGNPAVSAVKAQGKATQRDMNASPHNNDHRVRGPSRGDWCIPANSIGREMRRRVGNLPFIRWVCGQDRKGYWREQPPAAMEAKPISVPT